MDSHQFVPGPARIDLRKKRQRIIRPTREVGSIAERPDLESMSFIQQIVKMGIAGKKTSISTQVFREAVGQLARRNPESTMGINGKYLIHALDAGSIEDGAAEVFGVDTSKPIVEIDPELTMIALDEAFEMISEAANQGAKMVFACSRPAATLPMFIELARLAENSGAKILQSFDNTSSFIADGRKGRTISWVGSVGVISDGQSLLATNDAKAADDLLFHLPRPDLVVADHIFAGASLTNGYPTIAFAGLESLAVAIASIPENQCLTVPMSLDRSSTHYDIIANFAKSYFENC